MNALSAILLIAVTGCAAAQVPPAARAAQAQPLEVSQPVTVLHIGFTDADGNWSAPDWTNDWSFSALVSADLAAPLAQWTPIFPQLEMRNGVLTFELDGSGPQLFCKAVFQPR
jgi:hypothetical protein